MFAFFTTYYSNAEILFGEMGEACCRWRKQLHTGCWCVGVQEGDGLEDLGIDGRMIRKFDLNKYDWRVECIWLWISPSGLLLCER